VCIMGVSSLLSSRFQSERSGEFLKDLRQAGSRLEEVGYNNTKTQKLGRQQH